MEPDSLMDSQTVEIINRVLPILLLLFLGYWTRRSGFLNDELVEGLRKIVVNIALPAVLFVSFLNVDLKPSFLALAVIIFGLCVALYIFGRFLGPRVQPDHPYFKFLMTGFEYGMLGISLFGSAYGMGNIGVFAVVDLGHELFIWFAFLPLLLRERDGIQRMSDLLRSFLSSPVVIAILLSLLFNLLGWQEALYQDPHLANGLNVHAGHINHEAVAHVREVVAPVLEEGDSFELRELAPAARPGLGDPLLAALVTVKFGLLMPSAASLTLRVPLSAPPSSLPLALVSPPKLAASFCCATVMAITWLSVLPSSSVTDTVAISGHEYMSTWIRISSSGVSAAMGSSNRLMTSSPGCGVG